MLVEVGNKRRNGALQDTIDEISNKFLNEFCLAYRGRVMVDAADLSSLEVFLFAQSLENGQDRRPRLAGGFGHVSGDVFHANRVVFDDKLKYLQFDASQPFSFEVHFFSGLPDE